MFLRHLLLTKCNIMPTDKGEVLRVVFTGPVLVYYCCIIYYHKLSNLHRTDLSPPSFCGLGVWLILSGSSAWDLTCLKSRHQLLLPHLEAQWGKDPPPNSFRSLGESSSWQGGRAKASVSLLAVASGPLNNWRPFLPYGPLYRPS